MAGTHPRQTLPHRRVHQEIVGPARLVDQKRVLAEYDLLADDLGDGVRGVAGSGRKVSLMSQDSGAADQLGVRERLVGGKQAIAGRDCQGCRGSVADRSGCSRTSIEWDVAGHEQIGVHLLKECGDVCGPGVPAPDQGVHGAVRRQILGPRIAEQVGVLEGVHPQRRWQAVADEHAIGRADRQRRGGDQVEIRGVNVVGSVAIGGADAGGEQLVVDSSSPFRSPGRLAWANS